MSCMADLILPIHHTHRNQTIIPILQIPYFHPASFLHVLKIFFPVLAKFFKIQNTKKNKLILFYYNNNIILYFIYL